VTPGQLVKAVSIALDVSEETVVQHDRNLVVAGLRTKGGRGRAAPSVNHRDAARLVAAILGSVKVKDSASVVQRLEKIEFIPPRSDAEQLAMLQARGAPMPEKFKAQMSSTEKFSDQAIMALPSNHNFVDAIAALIGDASAPVSNLDEHLRRFAPLIISCDSPWWSASIGHMAAPSSAHYRVRNFGKGKPSSAPLQEERPPVHERYAKQSGITQKRTILGTAIILLGHAFRKDGLDFASTKAALEDCYGEKRVRQSKKAVS
jgi:hypothetical protein